MLQQRHTSSNAVLVPSQPQLPSAASEGGNLAYGAAATAVAAFGGAAGARRRRQQRGGLVGISAADGPRDVYGEEEAAAKSAVEKDSESGGAPEKKEPKNEGPFSALTDKWDSLPFETQEDFKTFFTSLTVALSIRAVFVEPRFIPSLSMYPTFDIGDQLTVDKFSRRWRDFQLRGVVVFNPPPACNQVTGMDRSGEALIKRIVAVEGDVVQVMNGGTLFINGEKQVEPFTNEAAKYNFGPVQVPPGCVFVLGDNRNQSLDGHVWGFLPKDNIIGMATLKFWPPWRVGTIQAAPE